MNLILSEVLDGDLPDWGIGDPALSPITHRASRHILCFLHRVESAWSGFPPEPRRGRFDSDAMGGLEWEVEWKTSRGVLTLAYRQSITESWSSVERHVGEGTWESIHGSILLDVTLVGTGRLSLSLPELPEPAMNPVRSFAREHFHHVETSEAYWARVTSR